MKGTKKTNFDLLNHTVDSADWSKGVVDVEAFDWQETWKRNRRQHFQKPLKATPDNKEQIHLFEQKVAQITDEPLVVICDIKKCDKNDLEVAIKDHLDFIALTQKYIDENEISLLHSNHLFYQRRAGQKVRAKHELLFNLKTLNQQKLRNLKSVFQGKVFKSKNTNSRFLLNVYKNKIIIRNYEAQESKFSHQREVNV